MNQEILLQGADLNLKKYHQGGLGFLVLNVLWFFLFFWFLPPFNLELFACLAAIFYLVLIVVLARFVYKGSRKLTIVLTVIFGGRLIVSIYALTSGEAFAVVPFVLPVHMVCFYLLGRAAWDWA